MKFIVECDPHPRIGMLESIRCEHGSQEHLGSFQAAPPDLHHFSHPRWGEYNRAIVMVRNSIFARFQTGVDDLQ